MKKTLVLLLSIFLLVTSFSTINAAEKSIENLGSIGQIDNANESYLIIYKDALEDIKYGEAVDDNKEENVEDYLTRVFYGENGIDIITSKGTIHLDTYYPVKKLLCLNDVNGDGYIEFLTYQKASGNSDQMFVISSKDGSVVSSFRLTYEKYDTTGNLGYVKTNSYISKMMMYQDKVYVLYDYSFIEVDPLTGEILHSYTNADNIWDVEFLEDKIAFVDQLGQLGFLNFDDLSLIGKSKISNTLEITSPYNESLKIDAVMNLWDLFQYNGELYILSEDGILYQYILDSQEVNEYDISVVDKEMFNNLIFDNYINGSYLPTGYSKSWFKNYKLIEIKDNLALISCFFIDNESISSYTDREYQCVLLYDLANKELISNIPFQAVSTKATMTFSQYKQNDNVVDSLTIMYPQNGNTMVKIYDYQGNSLFQKEIEASTATSNLISLKYQQDGTYLYEVYNSCSYLISNDLITVNPLFVRTTSNMLNCDDGITISYAQNEITKEISKLELDGKTIIWQYQVDEKYKHGIEKIVVDDYNNDGTKDYILLLNNYDSKDSPVDTTVVILSGVDGSKLVNSRLFLYKGYNEKGNYVSYYALIDNISLVKDLDKDGKKEIKISDGIVSSKNLSLKGEVSSYLDTKGVSHEIGDVNKDGFNDYVCITDSTLELFTSRITYTYNVDYVKSKSVKYNAAYKNSSLATLFSDVNNDGVKEIVLYNKNSSGYQKYDLYDGKSLTYLYSLCPEGVSDYDTFIVLDFDINKDGYNEILQYGGYDGLYRFIDGKTGKVMFLFDMWEKQLMNEDYVEVSYHPSEMVYFQEEEYQYSEARKMFSVEDSNNDGIDEFAVIIEYYDQETWDTINSIVVYDTVSLEVVDEIQINIRGVSNIVRLSNSDDYLLIKTYRDDNVTLFDLNKGSSLASFGIDCTNAYLIDENTLMVGNEKSIYLIDLTPLFNLLNKPEEVVDSNEIYINWSSFNKYGTMSIYDGNEQVYVTTDKNCTIKLTEGNHIITLSYDDGLGKVTKETFSVTVNKQKANRWYIVVVAVIVLVFAVASNMYRKIYINKLSKGGN